MKNDSYIYNGKTYPMTKHGFIRHNDSFKITSQSDSEIIFSISSDNELYKMFPFQFKLDICYTLNENKLTVNHTVQNLDSKTMYFSLGGHPAFTCPLYKDENYSDYYLEFENRESSESYVLDIESGLVTDRTVPVIVEENKIKLRGDLFNNDALIFKDLKSRKITLKHKNKGSVLSMNYKDFPYLGIWAKPNANYVCIEPWLGIADSKTTNQNIEEKEGINQLESGSIFKASYTIEIDHRHLA
jgi:galactose mutarotase-like enzyme